MTYLQLARQSGHLGGCPGDSVMRTARSAGSLPGDAFVMYPSENGMELFFATHGYSRIVAPLAFDRCEYELDEIDVPVE